MPLSFSKCHAPRNPVKDTVSCGKLFASFHTDVIIWSRWVLSPYESNLPCCKVCLLRQLPYSLHKILLWHDSRLERHGNVVSLCGKKKSIHLLCSFLPAVRKWITQNSHTSTTIQQLRWGIWKGAGMTLMRFNDLSSVINQPIKCFQSPTIGRVTASVYSNDCVTDQLDSVALVIGTELH